jgi:GntR family transcriptional regulator
MLAAVGLDGRRLRIVPGEGPPYEQLSERIRGLIRDGTLAPGERVPTVRALASKLDLAPNTVARAYRALQEDGWLLGRGRAGTFVADDPPVEDPSDALRAAARSYIRRAVALGFDRAAALKAVRSEFREARSSTSAASRRGGGSERPSRDR